MLVVSGYASLEKQAAPVVERKVRVRFRQGQRLAVDVYLTAVCFEPENVCKLLQQTCSPTFNHGNASGACGAVAEAPVRKTIEDPPAQNASVTAPLYPEDAPEGRCTMANQCLGSRDYPCTPNDDDSYVCLGQFAEWPMPDSVPGAKVPASYDLSTSALGFVTDLVTTLSWQLEPPKRYVGCSGKDKVLGDTCTWAEAKRYCHDLDLDGTGWRLPSKIELESLIDFRSAFPAIDVSVFPSDSGARFWTASTDASEPAEAWRVDFGQGTTNTSARSSTLHARCVRGVVTSEGQPGRYGYDDKVVSDTATKLTWERNVRASTDTTWYGANLSCLLLSGGPWRLPSVKELLTLVDPTRPDPSLDRLFGDVPRNSFFWSKTPVALFPGKHWLVNMTGGWTIDEQTLDLIFAMDPATPGTMQTRCVR